MPAEDSGKEIAKMLDQHHSRLRAMEEQVDRLAHPPARQNWLQVDLTEPAVQVALRDFVRGGDCAFDVGANMGGLSLLMSRLVGPRGQVCAFEANPEITRRCQEFLVNCGCSNTQLYNAAVYHKSMEVVPLHVSANGVSDSLYNRVSDTTIPVLTLALDDFVAEMKVQPSVVKMDIEAAEYDALLGFERTISNTRPILILEQQLDDERCLGWLLERDYVAIDLYEYKSVREFRELTRGTGATDIAYIPQEKLAQTPYLPPFSFEPVESLGAGDFDWIDQHVLLTRTPLSLPAGRYRFFADFSAANPDIELKVGLAEGQKPLMQYHGSSWWLSRVGRNWIFDAPRPLMISVYFNFPGERDATFEFSGVTVEKIGEFANIERRAWI